MGHCRTGAVWCHDTCVLQRCVRSLKQLAHNTDKKKHNTQHTPLTALPCHVFTFSLSLQFKTTQKTEATAACIVFDVTSPKTFEAVKRWKSDVDLKVHLHDGQPVPCILLANKVCTYVCVWHVVLVVHRRGYYE